MKQKNKKLYIVIITCIFVTIITYALSITKTEAPQINENLKANEEIIPEKEKIEVDSKEKYRIINRSIIVPEDITNKKNVVLLTIDDGPSKRTKEIMDILKNHNAKAIFFINGMHDKNNVGVIEQIIQEGFTVGNHTWSHLNLKKEKDLNIIEKEIIDDSLLINKLTGTLPRFFRAPYGESNTYIRNFVKENGMIFMDWSGSVIDWDKSTIEKDVFISNVTLNLRSGLIILIHEHPWSVANLDGLLTALEAKGYTYVDPENIIE